MHSIVFDPQGRYLASVSETDENHALHLWDLDTEQQVPLMNAHQAFVRDVVFRAVGWDGAQRIPAKLDV